MNKQSLLNQFNNPDTVGIISSFPMKDGEIALANAISRYTYLLTNSFPKNQNVVVFSEKGTKNEGSYLLAENILVVPSYKTDLPASFTELYKNIYNFSNIKDYLVQFEFSIYGGKKVIPSFLMALLSLKLLGKNTSLVLHQVVSDLNELSGHLGLHRGSFKINIYNLFLTGFYSLSGLLVDRIIVHDNLLKTRLSEFVSENEIVVVPHAVGDIQSKNINSSSKISARKSFNLAKNDKVIGVYGYRSWYKGTDWIIHTVRQLSLQYPGKHIKLLVAGGVSPTLKDTSSYKNFDRRIKRVVKEANGSVRVTGFVPEKDVWKVFAASDIMVFPYRTRMSASGAFSLTLAYKKPFLVSRQFAHGMGNGAQKLAFDLNTFSFEQKLVRILEGKSFRNMSISMGEKLAKDRSWSEVSGMYLNSVKNARILLVNGNEVQKSFAFIKV